MKVIKVNPEQLEQAWPHASKWIAKANLRGNSCYPLEDMKRDISDGKRLLLRCVAGPSFCWLVVGCVENSQNRTAIVYACGGDGVLGVLDETDGRALGGCSVGHVSGECEDAFNGRFGDFVASHGAELSKIRPGAQAENAETSGYFLSE